MINKKRTFFTLFIFIILIVGVLLSVNYQKKIQKKIVNLSLFSTDTLNYQFFLPQNNNPNKKYPLIVFLHGVGNSGNDNVSQLRMIKPWILDTVFQQEYPTFLLAPQCKAAPFNWINNSSPITKNYEPLLEIEEIIENLSKNHNIDLNKIYLIGYSMGAAGVWELLSRSPNKYAAAIVFSGWSPVENVQKLKQIPIRIYHSRDDQVVSPTSDRNMFKALSKLKAPVLYFEYSGIGHNTWKQVISDKELPKWLFSKILK